MSFNEQGSPSVDIFAPHDDHNSEDLLPLSVALHGVVIEVLVQVAVSLRASCDRGFALVSGPSPRPHKAINHFFLARLFEIDRQFAAFDKYYGTIAKFVVKHPLA